MNSDPWFVYIIECRDGSLYTGVTTDLSRRLIEHNRGVGSKYTRSRRPVTCLFSCKYDSRSLALSEEWRIKQLSRTAKLAMIEHALGNARVD